MSVSPAPSRDEPGLAGLVRTEGSAASAWAQALATGRGTRDLGDAAHALCDLYGHHPSCIDLAAARVEDGWLAGWLRVAAEGFAAERHHIATIVAAAGPIPSTPGQAQSEAALAGQRHALEVLSRSDRPGCAVGAAVGLVLDWQAVRPVLDHVAEAFALLLPPSRLPQDFPEDDLAADRARSFGARQLLAQQGRLWDLLEARAAARETR